MALVQISDVIVPEVFFGYMQKETTEKSAIFSSGILRQDANLAAKLSGGGRTFNVPFWKDLDNTESDTASDDPDSEATPGKIATATDIARRQVRTRGWSSADLTAELAGADPMRAMSGRVAAYWVRQFQSILVNTLRGLFADNIANDAGDMVVDIGTDAAPPITAAELISAEAIMDAAQTMGDAKETLDTLIMHSVVYTRLAKQNLIDFIPNAEGRIRFPSYLGYNVIQDDGVPAIAGVNRTEYWTFLVGRQSIGWAESPVQHPVSTQRFERKGNGMGIEELWTRRQFAIHPYGIKWTDANVAQEFPTNAELRSSLNWDRVYAERKQINMALLITNG